MNGKLSWSGSWSGIRPGSHHDGAHREHHEPVGLYFVVALICGALALALPSRH